MPLKKNEIVMMYMDGLGNQMFQYALQRKKELQGCLCYADLSEYQRRACRSFVLQEVFPGISLRFNRELDFRAAAAWGTAVSTMDQNLSRLTAGRLRLPHPLFDIERTEYRVDEDVLQTRRRILYGYWQAIGYFSDIREALLSDFVFAPCDPAVSALAQQMEAEESVAIHVRGGDYQEHLGHFGHICTPTYYQRALSLLGERIASPRYYVFTNDPAYCRQILNLPGAVFVQETLPGARPDWTDMMLMTHCRHHIIANSTFSFWGAWLAGQEGGIHITPARWVNVPQQVQLYPEGWQIVDGQ